MADTLIPSTFEIRIYSGDRTTGEPLWTSSGTGDEWQLCLDVRLPGFDSYMSVSLHDFWRTIFEHRLTVHTAPARGYETIVKFGRTQQLKTSLTVTANLAFPASV